MNEYRETLTESRTYDLVEKATNKLVTTGTFYGPKARKQAGAWLMGWNRRQSGRYELRERKFDALEAAHEKAHRAIRNEADAQAHEASDFHKEEER